MVRSREAQPRSLPCRSGVLLRGTTMLLESRSHLRDGVLPLGVYRHCFHDGIHLDKVHLLIPAVASSLSCAFVFASSVLALGSSPEGGSLCGLLGAFVVLAPRIFFTMLKGSDDVHRGRRLRALLSSPCNKAWQKAWMAVESWASAIWLLTRENLFKKSQTDSPVFYRSRNNSLDINVCT